MTMTLNDSRESSESPKKPFRGFAISLMGLSGIFKNTQMFYNSIFIAPVTYFSGKLTKFFIEVNALKARCVILRFFPVPYILSKCNVSKVAKFVVSGVSVYVIYDAFRPRARHVEPRQSMSGYGSALNADVAVAVTITTSSLKEPAGFWIVNKIISKLSRGDVFNFFLSSAHKLVVVLVLRYSFVCHLLTSIRSKWLEGHIDVAASYGLRHERAISWQI